MALPASSPKVARFTSALKSACWRSARPQAEIVAAHDGTAVNCCRSIITMTIARAPMISPEISGGGRTGRETECEVGHRDTKRPCR